MVPEDLQPTMASPNKGVKALKWEVFVETAGIWGEADFIKNGFVDHINTTKDTTDYLWYTTRFVLLNNIKSYSGHLKCCFCHSKILFSSWWDRTD
jgi:hypothetical protein